MVKLLDTLYSWYWSLREWGKNGQSIENWPHRDTIEP